jgi:nicotinamide mononucleotide (NMN) deamidase PncC
VRHKGKVDLGLGITGIAGPGGGSKEKPVGLVYIALSSEEGVRVQKFHFSGDRLMNKRFASQSALVMIFQYLKEKFGNEFNYHQKLCGFRPSL